MRFASETDRASREPGWKNSWKNADDAATPPEQTAGTVEARPRIPGCVWRHNRTGGYYWTIKSALVPAERRGRGDASKIPLVPLGGGSRRGATRNREIALRCQRRLWLDWHDADRQPAAVAAPRSVEGWLAEFQDYNRLQASDRQAAYNGLIVRAMLSASGVPACHEISARHVESYLASLKSAERSARTIQAHRNACHKFCKFLVRRQQLDSNPVDLIDVSPPVKRPPRYLDDLQQSAALSHLCEDLPPWMFDAVCVALYAGGRLGSLRALRCEHVQPGALVLPLPKVGDYALVPLNDPIIGPELGPLLNRIRAGRPGPDLLFPLHVPQWWVQGLHRATRRLRLPVFGELPGCRAGNQWHLLRATWAVNCARRGATLWQLMQWGGWRIPTTVMRYVNIARAAGMASLAAAGSCAVNNNA